MCSQARPRVTRVLEGLPNYFQKEALLRIYQLGVTWSDVEEQRIKTIDIIEEAATHQVRRPAIAPSGCREVSNRVTTLLQVFPELVQVWSVREPSGHANDRDVVLSKW